MPEKPSESRPMNLKTQVAVVTGSTSGIGLGIARALAKNGATVILNGFAKPEEVTQIKQELSDYGTTVDYIGADMSKAEEIESMMGEVQQRYGRIDILVNNAGIQHTARTEDFPAERWDQILAINLSAAFHTIRHSLPGMQQRGYGRIVNIASVHGLIASQEKSAYVAAKHGIVGLSKVVALENATADITCNAICPGWVFTPLVEKQIRDRAEREGKSYDDASRELVGEKQPSQRFAKVEDLAAAVLFLASPAGASVTGISLPVDGGWTAH
jgi:3-hydroxybutyrate dehydrogenase